MMFSMETEGHWKYHFPWPGTGPTHDISIEFEIQLSLVMLLFIKYSADHN